MCGPRRRAAGTLGAETILPGAAHEECAPLRWVTTKLDPEEAIAAHDGLIVWLLATAGRSIRT
jgi:hypothetical protein